MNGRGRLCRNEGKSQLYDLDNTFQLMFEALYLYYVSLKK